MAKIGNLQVGSIKFANGTLAKYFTASGSAYGGGPYSATSVTLSDTRDRPVEVHCNAAWTYFANVGAANATFLARLRRNRSGSYTTFMEYSVYQNGTGSASRTLNWSVVDVNSQAGDIWLFEVAISPQNNSGGTLTVSWTSRAIAAKISRF